MLIIFSLMKRVEPSLPKPQSATCYLNSKHWQGRETQGLT